MIVDKYFNVENNSLKLTAELIKIFHRKNRIEIDDLFKMFNLKYPERSFEFTFEALGLLYLTNKIDYDQDTDNLEVIYETN